MRKLYLLLSLIIFTAFLNNCATSRGVSSVKSNWVMLEDAQNGQFLDRAKTISIDEFFNLIMENPMNKKKSNKPTYDIIYDTAFWTYIGVIKIDSKNETIVDPFYKVDAQKLKLIFPAYLDVDGTHIKSKIYYQFVHDIIETKLKPICQNRHNIEYPNSTYKLTKKGIEAKIAVNGYCYDDLVLGGYLDLILDPSTLEVISEKNKIKEYTKSKDQIEAEKALEAERKSQQIKKAIEATSTTPDSITATQPVFKKGKKERLSDRVAPIDSAQIGK